MSNKIEEIREFYNRMRRKYVWSTPTSNDGQMMIEKIKEAIWEIDRLTAENAELKTALEKAEQENRWISVEEALPKLKDDDDYGHIPCLVSYDWYGTPSSDWAAYQRTIVRGKRVERWEDRFGRIIGRTVTHWRPLPEAPKGE